MTEKLESKSAGHETLRERLLRGLAVSERRVELAGISTAVLEGGHGPPVVLLHGPGVFAAEWMHVIPALIGDHRVIAPDLPGHGASEVLDGPLDPERVLAWLDELIETTCSSPPALVGHLLGGAIAARFAAARTDRVSRLVLVGALGLGRFRPAPSFAAALVRFMVRPSERSCDRLWRRCTFDFDRLRDDMDGRWEAFAAYYVERARDANAKAAQRALMGKFGMPVIPAEQLERIEAPTALIWGRHNAGLRLSIAEAVSERHGWPLHVIEDAGDEPELEQPAAFVRALRSTLGAGPC